MNGKLTVGAILFLALGASAAWAQSLGADAQQPFQVRWEATRDGGGPPLLQGYVYNTGRYEAQRMQMEVEALDGSGRVLHTSTGYVPGTIPAGQRAYFALAVPAAQTYRIRVRSFEWSRCGDG